MQGVPRRVLKVILSIESGKKSQNQQRAQEKQPTSTLPAPSLAAARGPAPISRQSHVTKLEKALSIIAKESGLAVSDLTENTVFVDVGIDSLLGLTISARFKEELDVDVDFNELFYECPTVLHLKTFLGEPETSSPGSSIPSSSHASSTPRSSMTGNSTPTSKADSFALEVDFQRALQIISEESGVAMDDLTSDTNFSESGVDSLLSLVITSRFRDELELDIALESLFRDFPTVADLRRLLVKDTTTSDTVQPLTESKPEPTSTPEIADGMGKGTGMPLRTESETAALAARSKAVDEYVQK